MKLTLTIAAVMLATAAGAERLDTSGFYNGGGFDHAPDAYTPSNPSPGRGGTYDGDDGYTQPRGLGYPAAAAVIWATQENDE